MIYDELRPYVPLNNGIVNYSNEILIKRNLDNKVYFYSMRKKIIYINYVS